MDDMADRVIGPNSPGIRCTGRCGGGNIRESLICIHRGKIAKCAVKVVTVSRGYGRGLRILTYI